MAGEREPKRITYSPGLSLYNRDEGKTEWLVESLIPRGALFCLNGRGSTFKSWTMTALGMSVALASEAGSKFMGKFPCPLYAPRNSVLFVQLEESPRQAQRKLRYLLAGERTRPFEIASLLFGYVVGQPFRIDSDEYLDSLKRLVEQTTPDLVIWDNARKMKLGSENDSEWGDEIAFRLKQLQTVYPSAHGLVHHWRKRSAEKSMNDPDQMGRGSEGLRDACDVWLPVELSPEGVLTMHQTKNRDGELVRPFNYSVRIVDSAGLATLEYAGPAVSSEGPNAASAILETLEADPQRPRSKPDLITELSELGYSADQTRRAIEALRRSQEIYVKRSKGRTPSYVVLIRYAGLLPDEQPGNQAEPGEKSRPVGTPYKEED